MTLPRAVGLVLIVTTVCVAVVWVRMQRVRTAHEIHQLVRQETELVREIDQIKATIARLRAPDRVRQRVSNMKLSVLPPESRLGADAPDRLAGNNRLPHRPNW
ncbi:MAG: hypothetical protein JXQ73_29160 [Phycisphaerae bacterium]|nr:hypothetical protein [Phycisphaerae bacterium]